MPSGVEPGVESFFASRGGVCVYVRIEGHNFRVQFADPDAHGTVSEGPDGPGAEKALKLARGALSKHSLELAALFEKVARGRT